MILVPYDFSPKSTLALKQALYIADLSGMPIEIIHITNKAAMLEYPPKWNYKNFDRQYLEGKLRQIVIQMMNKALLRYQLSFSIYITESVLISGSIIKRALSKKAKLIVMGTHGFSGIKEVLMGSNTSSIINQAFLPVLAVPSVWKPRPLKKLIVAVETEKMKTYKKQTEAWASLMKCKVDWVGFYYLPDKQIIQRSQEKHPELKLLQANVVNSLAENLVDYTAKQKEAALMMFVHQRNFFQKIFNASITEKVSGLIRIPLLAIPIKK